MKSREIEYLNGEFTTTAQVPATIDEIVALLGEEAVVDSATDDTLYRNKYPRDYRKVSDRVAKDHGFARAVKEQKTLKSGTVRDVLVSEMDHIRAFLAEDPANRQVLQALFDEVASDPLYIKGERTGGGGKVSQASLDAANGYFAKGDEAVAKIVEYLERTIPGYKVGRDADGEVTIDGMARGIAALQKHNLAEAAKQTASGLAGLGV